MQDFEPIDIDFIINKNDVRRDAADVKKQIVGVGEAAEEAEAKAASQFNNLYQNRAKQVDATTQAISRQKVQFNGLNNSVAQITRELPAFLYSAQTGFLAISNNIPILADEIGRIRKENELLTASGKKGVPVLQQLAKSIFSWNTLLSVGVTLVTVYGKEIASLIQGLFNTKEAMEDNERAAQALNKAYDSSSYQKAIGNILELKANVDLAKKGIIDQKDAVNQYNKVLGEAAGTVETLAEAEQGLIDKAPAYIEIMLLKAAAAQAQAEVAKELAEAAKEEQQLREEIAKAGQTLGTVGEVDNTAGNQFLGPNANFTADQIRANAQKATDAIEESVDKREELAEKGADIIQRFNEQAAKLAEAAGIDLFPEGNKKVDQQLKEREKLLNKIKALDEDYAQEQYSEDEAELQALRTKFQKIRDLVTDFNNNPKNSKIKIDLTGLSELEQKAEQSLIYAQGTEALREEVLKQRDIYKKYEEDKADFGIQKANEMYEGQKAAYSDYLSFLKAKIAENQDAIAASGAGTGTQAQVDRATLLQNALKTEKTAQARHYQELLFELRNYETERADMVQRYNELRQELIAKGNEAEAEELGRRFKETLDDLDTENAERTKEYQALMNGVDDLSGKLARKVVDDAKQMVAALEESGRLSREAADQILKDISRVEGGINANDANSTQDLARNFSEIGFQLQKASDKITQSVGKMVTEIAGAFGTFADKDSSTLQKATGLVSLIVSLGRMQKEIGSGQLNKVVNEQRSITNELAEQLTIETAINEIRRERAELERNSSAFLDSTYQDEFTASLRKKVDSEADLRDAMQKLAQNGIFTSEGVGKRLLFGSKTEDRDFSIQQILGSFEVGGLEDYDGFFVDPLGALLFGAYSDKNVSKDALNNLRTTFQDTLTSMGKTAADMASFSATEWLDFYTVMEEAGKIQDGATKELLANAKQAAEDYQEALEEMREVIGDVAGSLAGDLRDSLVSAFTDGSDAADNFLSKLNNVINSMFLDQLINSQFKTYFDSLQEEMEASFGADGDGSWVDDLKRFGDSIGPQTEAALEAIRLFDEEMKKQGYDGFTSEDSTSSGLTGAIRRELTEETASELTGLYRNTLDITRRHFELAEKCYLLDQRNFDSTVAIMKSNALIEINTRNSANQLALVVSRLDDIKTNTKQGQTARDLGLAG